MALGNVERGRKKFADCAQTYTKGIDVIAASTENKPNWVYYYFRGICEERSKNWDKAEVDMKKALEIQPEQPHVLNYLGYSWIDRGTNLDEAMKMIKRAVDQRPDDGYIVDCLGWAYYRIGNYEEAVKTLERAIESEARRPDGERSPRRRLLARRPDAGGKIPVGARARPEAGGGRATEDRGQDRERLAGRRNPLGSLGGQEKGRRQGRLSAWRTGRVFVPVMMLAPPARLPDPGAEPQSQKSFDLRAVLDLTSAMIVTGTTNVTSAAPALSETARAKVNLTLRVIGRRADGFHDLESVVAFADCADRLTLTPGTELSLVASGPRAQECGETADNLVLKAARLLGERCRESEGGRFRAGQAFAGRGRHRRRFGGCGRGAAVAGAGQRPCD